MAAKKKNITVHLMIMGPANLRHKSGWNLWEADYHVYPLQHPYIFLQAAGASHHRRRKARLKSDPVYQTPCNFKRFSQQTH